MTGGVARALERLVRQKVHGVGGRRLRHGGGHARKHAAQVTVTLTEQPRGQNGIWADISIDDDGPGIPEEAREDAFKPFTSLSGGGTGLGLAIARDIARAHGGDVFLEDSPLGGLRARIRVPG
jgi:two-component system osmolarity sensor histidine kinase EnvZ